MNAVEQNLDNWKNSLFKRIPVADLIARNPVAHKWKAPFRAMILRETVFWRLSDLLSQSYALHRQGHGLGARILLRSAFETLGSLIYLNRLMERVLEGALNFHVFGKQTSNLLLGSRNNPEGPKSTNILTILTKANKRYPGLMELYENLSESAHPSYEGLCWGYSTVNYEEYETTFSNRWMELFGDRHVGMMDLCMTTFQHEYNDVWEGLFEKLEKWIEANDEELELTKNNPLPVQ